MRRLVRRDKRGVFRICVTIVLCCCMFSSSKAILSPVFHGKSQDIVVSVHIHRFMTCLLLTLYEACHDFKRSHPTRLRLVRTLFSCLPSMISQHIRFVVPARSGVVTDASNEFVSDVSVIRLSCFADTSHGCFLRSHRFQLKTTAIYIPY